MPATGTVGQRRAEAGIATESTMNCFHRQSTPKQPECAPLRPIWDDLVAQASYLRVLEQQVPQLRGLTSAQHWEAIKVSLRSLVGWYRLCGPPWMRTSAAWDAAAHHLAALLSARRGRRRCCPRRAA